ncbi:hypothetical protein C1H46_013211 [Malus baccata]|uniref:AATF leucine zipper-containing domain-containing protein n=1 Tax=Malus baccata TaxID=106549 RepID=A0A540MQZ0_MALBA|nr:hypothetical protein C1H46_013211 [Malus baccata]
MNLMMSPTVRRRKRNQKMRKKMEEKLGKRKMVIDKTIIKMPRWKNSSKNTWNLRHQEQDILKNLKGHKDEDLLKGQAVKNQKALWDKALEFRFLLQKAFSSSHRLPQEPVRSLFCDSHEGVNAAYSDLVDSSRELWTH